MADPNSPWGRRPTSGGGNSSGNNSGGPRPGSPNPFEKIIRDSQQKMRGAIGGGGDNGINEKRVVVLALAAIFFLWMGSGI